jgi:hypothetical protein
LQVRALPGARLSVQATYKQFEGSKNHRNNDCILVFILTLPKLGDRTFSSLDFGGSVPSRHLRTRAFRMGATRPPNMKTDAPLELREPLYTFRCEAQGYDIALIPHSERDRDRLKRKARKLDGNLAKLCETRSWSC